MVVAGLVRCCACASMLLGACSAGHPGVSADAGADAADSGGAKADAGALGSSGSFAGSGSGGSSGASGSSGSSGSFPTPETRAIYGNPTIEPDVSTDKVSDCAGQPDMTLCDVVTRPDRWYDVCVAGVCVSPGCGDNTCNTPGAHFRMPPFEGHIYLEKQAGDEPVTIDKVTGLHWTSCASGMSGADCSAGTSRGLVPTDALAYCDVLSWAGHNDWYLPDIFELVSLADLAAKVAPMARQAMLSDSAFPNQRLVNAFYWSSTYLDDEFQVFSTGQNQLSAGSVVDGDRPSDEHPVLCVRRGFSKPIAAGERFITYDWGNGRDPWFQDRATGMSFQGCTSRAEGACGDTMITAAEASMHCRNLSWGSFTDWRLPTYKELLGSFDPIHAGNWDPGLSTRYFGKVDGPYLLVAPSGLFSVPDMARVGVGIASKLYPVLCARGPFEF